jgi:hypothetical protein
MLEKQTTDYLSVPSSFNIRYSLFILSGYFVVIMKEWNDGMMEEWKNGMMEWWNVGKTNRLLITDYRLPFTNPVFLSKEIYH